MKITLSTSIGDYGQIYASSAITTEESLFVEAFQPMDIVDDPALRLIGGVMKGDEKYERKMSLRRDVARVIASGLTRMIMSQLESMDTVNGYKVVKNEEL